VSSKLLLWIDENHDGISQPYELHPLPELGVFSISLYYADDHHDDPYGNWFHYRAALNPDPQDGQSRDGRWSYDVFFDTAVGGAGEGGGHCRMIFEDRLDFGRDHPIGGGGIPPCNAAILEVANETQDDSSLSCVRRFPDERSKQENKGADQSGGSAGSGASGVLQLTATAKIPLMGTLVGKGRCDDRGDIYVRFMDADMNRVHHGITKIPIEKINPDGSMAATFRVTDAFADISGKDFFVSGDGQVYQAGFMPDGRCSSSSLLQADRSNRRSGFSRLGLFPIRLLSLSRGSSC
jgi:hypothetical protein